MAKTAEVIVLGTGGVGSAALYQLARRGVSCLGIDRFPPGHDRGSSHGETRMIRMSYFEHPDYVPLLRKAYSLWDELAETRGESLFHRTGLVYFGAPDGAVLDGIRTSAVEHGLDVESVAAEDVGARFPGFRVPIGARTLFEADAGYLLVEDCVRAHLAEATRLGAQHVHGETIRAWAASDGHVVVETDRDRYEAGSLVVTAGCWAESLLGGLGLKLRVMRKHLHWRLSESDVYRESHGCPCFFFESDGGFFYGFPEREGAGVKVAEHSGGVEIRDPLNDPRAVDEEDAARINAFLDRCLPGVSATRSIRREVCFYTMSRDEHFIVDRHPEHGNVSFAAGLSGHGFKFAPVLGSALADVATENKTRAEIGFLRLDRPGLKG